jgi:hypothetical protein
VEYWAKIRTLHRAEGMAIRAIARWLGISRNTVKGCWPARYVRASAVDAVEPEIRLLLAEFPAVPTAVIMERVGWERGRRCSSSGLRSCGRCSGRLIRRRGRSNSLGSWRRVICGAAGGCAAGAGPVRAAAGDGVGLLRVRPNWHTRYEPVSRRYEPVSPAEVERRKRRTAEPRKQASAASGHRMGPFSTADRHAGRGRVVR